MPAGGDSAGGRGDEWEIDRAPTPAEPITADWLTTTLQHAGVLGRGTVTHIERRPGIAVTSDVLHLTVRYADAAPPEAPRRLLLKRNGDGAGAAEAGLYRLVAGSAVPVSRERLLAGDGVPPAVQLDQVIDALARFHAHWWEHRTLGAVPGVTEIRGWYRDAAHYQCHVLRRQVEWASFLRSSAGELPSAWRFLLERVLSRLPYLWHRYLGARVSTLRQMTLTHGDCYLTQFPCPRDAGAGGAVLVDFQDVSANIGAFDLVYLLATFWTSEQRGAQRREERLLRRYHATLLVHGVEQYGWNDLVTDYRLMLALMIFEPIWNGTAGAARGYWSPKLRCLIDALADCRCLDLFES